MPPIIFVSISNTLRYFISQLTKPLVNTQLRYSLCLLIIFFYQLSAFAQQSKVDSLLLLLKTDKADTTKLNHLILLSRLKPEKISAVFLLNITDSILYLSNEILKQTTQKDIVKKAHLAKSDAYNTIGLTKKRSGDFNESLDAFKNALATALIIDDKTAQINVYNNIGNLFRLQGNYAEAIANHLLSQRIAEQVGDKKALSRSYNNIGNINDLQGDTKRALENHMVSLKIKEQIGDTIGAAISYANIGLIYQGQKNHEDALTCFRSALKIMKAKGRTQEAASQYNNIGIVYFEQNKYIEALDNHFKSLELRNEIGDSIGLSQSYENIAKVFFSQRKYKQAEDYYLKSKKIAERYNNKNSLNGIYSGLASIYRINGNYKEAYDNYKLSILYRDSIFNEESRKKIVEAQMTYDFEKKETATKAKQDKKDIIAKEELKQKTLQRNYFVLAFVLIALLALFIFRGYKQKQEANRIITQQKTEVEKAKHIIEEKNKDITDSINYAKRIQLAMLPDSEELRHTFPKNFILFKPKDIVSGDFYFFHQTNHIIYIAVADCTGHGVPGAFMSLIGTDKLHEAVLQSSNASEILMLLNKGIKKALKQSDATESTRDGMDIALCTFNLQTHVLTYAGANRPLWVVRKNTTETEEIKPTKCAIGGLTSNQQEFESTQLNLKEDDTFYMSTDGYADQFNGQTDKKLMTKKFKEILCDIQGQSMDEQKLFLENFINAWKSGTEQVDDILVVGIRI